MKLTMLVGPPGSGKSTLAKELCYDKKPYRVNQDEMGKKEHFEFFELCLTMKDDVVIDRMNLNVEQRKRYLEAAKNAAYETEIIVLHESKETCLKRGIERLYKEHHPTIKTEEDLHRAVNFFFSKYERPTEDEADIVTYRYPEKTMKLKAILCDIDGTMAKIDHRQHFVKDGKKDWKNFLLPQNVEQDTVNEWCRTITNDLRDKHIIVMCSGRTETLKNTTTEWLEKNKIFYDHLFMRPADDYRQDNIIKEIILDFEILTRFTPYFVIDDRDQVVKMWRNRGIVCLQCQEGNF